MWDAHETPKQDNKCIRFSRCSGSVLLVVLIVGYVAFPFIFRYSAYVKSNLTFLNFVKNPLHEDFHRPSEHGFVGARNFYLGTKDGATLGVWHMLPTYLHTKAADLNTGDPYNTTVLSLYNSWLSEGIVFLYFHGSVGSRASPGRIKLYHLLNTLGYHVVAFDYRGYGDSSHQPKTEHDVIVDAETVYSWLVKHVTTGRIFFWGHSLGTGVLSHLLENLEEKHESKVTAAILESSFNNMADALRTYPPSLPYSRLPWFDFFAIEPMNMNGLTFRSDLYLKNVSLPLLFLHAEDDMVVPFKLGMKLYKSVLSSREDTSTVTFVAFDKELELGHTGIHQDPNLGPIVQNFVKKSIQETEYANRRELV